MKGMPGLYYAVGAGPGRPPKRVGSVFNVDADRAEVRRMYDRDEATPLPPADPNAGSRRPSVSAFVRRIVGLAGAAT
jgi:hypothetical protein